MICTWLSAQNFFGSVVFGTNISQIDGDNAAGFNKYNITGGLKIDYPIKPAIDLSAELLYSGRGSKDTRKKVDIKLNYIEIPLLISIRDWYIEKDKYDKVRADIGLSYGYLFSADAKLNFAQYVTNLKKHDVSFVLGAGYMFNRNLGLSIRYTRSLYKVIKDPLLESGGLLSYFTTARLEYHF
jgi:Outer membrane protein beta-barrel domain